ncbi:CGNR zinc finger domain-containing protein [Allonocardiopsis opalescens]|uniref:Putative stress-induced transcription regulator n=1 Tax=Allonocardiopsis opalescens TaxID=1144618 RepID=A0A2T0QFN0_9ACTN|nr:CGNR zinc finger domain-containing protein [Allonocardiopsis opalescens]PRY02722.1 putative stress-induced transcription regulator [Allonocardiopsis opalescens]
MVYDREPAPDPLAPVERFCNTVNRLTGDDALAELAGARAWLRERAGVGGGLDESGRAELVRFRETLRDHLAGGSERAAAELSARAAAVLGPPRWRAGGGAELPVTASAGPDLLAGRLLAVLAAEELAGRRARLKVCRAQECRWVFYDRSPGNNSVWCSMAICGARHKMRAYRSRRRAADGG